MKSHSSEEFSGKDRLESGGISRRRFLEGAALGAAWIAAGPLASSARGAPSPRPTVAVFGGGVAGLTAAHELAERGFDVTVYERRAWGGKARSMDIPGTASGGRLPLPGEHGLRVVFGFEQNLPDTMQRIPFESNREGVFDNLVALPIMRLSRAGERDLVIPFGRKVDGYSPADIRETILGLALETDLPPQAAVHFADRMVVFLSSSDARRYDQWENTSWEDFIQADRYGGDYRKILSETFSHLLQASTADGTSARFVAKVFEWLVYNLLARNSNGPVVRLLNLPTNEAWIDPWLALLTKLGVALRLGHTLEAFEVQDGSIVGASVRGPSGLQTVVADYFICALPVERARQLWSPAILAADPRLSLMSNLRTDWMNGMKFFLRKPTSVARGGVAYLDSPWVLASVSQAQFWSRDFAATYGDGTAHETFSVIISDWNTPGNLYSKPARDLEPEQVAREVWQEMKRHLNDAGEEILTDDLIHSWHIDPGLIRRPEGGFENEDPLVLPSVGAWRNQPEAGTAIPNLILAGDYVRGEWEVGNMEIANETGRRAANAVLERSGSRECPVEVFPTYRPPEWEALKKIDEKLYRAGERNLFDTVSQVPLGLLES